MVANQTNWLWGEQTHTYTRYRYLVMCEHLAYRLGIIDLGETGCQCVVATSLVTRCVRATSRGARSKAGAALATAKRQNK